MPDTPPTPPPTTMVGAVAGLRDAFADLVADMAEALRPAPPKHRRANRPINVASLRQVIDELRAYADAAPPAEPLAPETALWTARLLDMPVGHLLAYAEQAGAERARDLGEIASECDDGTCPVAQAVHDALLDAGPWDQIDGDGSVASVLADRVLDLARWYSTGALLVANLDRFAATEADATIGDTICQGTTFNYRAELGELFDRIADRKSRADETVDRLVVFCHGSDGQLRRVGDVDPVVLRPDGEPLTIINPRAAVLVETGRPTLPQPEHLQLFTSDRGFRRFPPVQAWHGGRQVGEVSVAESSAATGPHLWLGVKDFATPGMPAGAPTSVPMELSAHLPLDQAEHLRDQLTWLIDHHYQGDPLDQPPAFPEVAANVDPDTFCDWASRAEWEEFADWCSARGLFVTPVWGVGGQLSEGDGFPGALHVEQPGRPDRLTVRPMDRLTREGGAWRVERRVPRALATDDPGTSYEPVAYALHPPGDFTWTDVRQDRHAESPPFEPAEPEPPAVDIGPIADAVDHHTPGRISGPGPVVWDGSAEHASHVIDWVLSRGGTASYDDRDPSEPVIRVNVKRNDVPGVAILAPGQALTHEADGRWSVTSARLVAGVDPATDDLPNVAMAIIPADGGPPQILPAPTVETFVVDPDPAICPGSGRAVGDQAMTQGSAACSACFVQVPVDVDGFLEQHPAGDPI